jgi:hypothetical protein
MKLFDEVTNFFAEVWTGSRPYLVKIATDFLVSGSLYVALFFFKALTWFLPVGGWAGLFIVHLHSAGMVASIAIFAWLSVNDIMRIHGSVGACFA